MLAKEWSRLPLCVLKPRGGVVGADEEKADSPSLPQMNKGQSGLVLVRVVVVLIRPILCPCPRPSHTHTAPRGRQCVSSLLTLPTTRHTGLFWKIHSFSRGLPTLATNRTKYSMCTYQPPRVVHQRRRVREVRIAGMSNPIERMPMMWSPLGWRPVGVGGGQGPWKGSDRVPRLSRGGL